MLSRLPPMSITFTTKWNFFCNFCIILYGLLQYPVRMYRVASTYVPRGDVLYGVRTDAHLPQKKTQVFFETKWNGWLREPHIFLIWITIWAVNYVAFYWSWHIIQRHLKHVRNCDGTCIQCLRWERDERNSLLSFSFINLTKILTIMIFILIMLLQLKWENN